LALPMRIDNVEVLADVTDLQAPVSAVARQVGPDCFDCLVVDAAGTVAVRLDAYRTVPLPTPIADSIAADLRAAFAE
jgi:hypothetical protein